MRKSVIVGLACLLLTGCSGGYNTNIQKANEKVMTIGDSSYTKEELYSMLKKSVGPATAINELQKLIYDAEIPVNDEIKKEAEDEYNTMAEQAEDINAMLEENGYTKETYLEKIVIPNIQSDKLLDKYFDDNKAEIKKEYKASTAYILQCDDDEKAKKALEELKSGKDKKEVFEQYQSENASYSDDEVLVSTLSNNLPTRMINTLYKQKEAGVVDEVFTSESATASYVAILVENNYDKVLPKLKETLATDTDFATKCVQFYLKKHDFKIHDQDVFNDFKTNYPQFLVSNPELSEAQ